jgi:diguanylate cyclase (GGDEF)-like protein/PAS domain S-box-containing protein
MEAGIKEVMRLLDEVGEGVYFTDAQRRITFWNKAAERISGYSKKEVLGRKCFENILIHVDGRGRSLCRGLCPLARTLKDRQTRQTRIFLHHKQGHRVPVQVRVFPLRNEKRRVIGAAELFTDRSEKPELWERMHKLEKLAMSDRLTSVANRHFSEQYLQARLEEFNRFHWPFGIIFFDIDDFKTLNDRHSHRVGDRALKTVANTLQSNIRAIDQVGRWGGEEFIVILRNPSKSALRQIAEQLRLLVEKSIFWEKGTPIRVTLSGGVTMVAPGDSTATLVERADLLMYQSKKAGKNRISGS